MIRLAAAALALLAGGVPGLATEGPAGPADQFAAAIQVIVRQQIIIRVPQPGRGVPVSATTMHWREGNGPRCLAANQILAATPSQSSVDFIMRDQSRVRARLGRRCGGLDYYRGFYLNTTSDGRVCAERDSIRSRMGGECGIAEFRSLQPVRR
jgi:hypothetical protein